MNNSGLVRFGIWALAAGLAAAALPAVANDDLVMRSSDAGQWPMYGRDYANTHYSPLKQITAANVKDLKFVYSLQLGALRSNEATPIVVGDTLYVSSSFGPKPVFALENPRCG